MAPDPSSQKRKRGRPPNASRQEADATQDRTAAADEYDADADEERRLKKRERLRKRMDSVTEEQPAPRDSTEPKRKRGRPSLGKSKTTQVSIVEDGDIAPPAKRKRGRPSLGNQEVEVAVMEEAGPSSRNKRKNASQDGQTKKHQDAESQADPRERRSRRHAEKNRQPQEPQQQEEDTQATEPPPRRKRGRPSLQSRQEVGENLEQTEEPRNPRKRGRPSLQDMPPSEVQNKTAKPSKSGQSSKEDETAAVDNTQSKKEGKRRGRSGGSRAPTGRTDEPQPTRPEPEPEPEAVESNAEPTESSQLQKKKRRRSNQNADPEDDFPPSPPKPYPHIAPYVRHVRQSIIETKWSPLAESSLSAASAILHLAHRPILQRLSNTQQRRTHTSDALRLLANRITRKVTRGLPFPPASMTARAPRSSRATAAADDGGRAVELDFESVLDAKQALERQLDPALHAVELLNREKEKLERELERDYEALRNLESSAKAQAREHRGLLKKAHILAPTPETVASQRRAKEESDTIFRHEGPSMVAGLFDDLKDEELKSLALQLGNHMESMKNNLQQTEGIIPQLARSRAALQDVLLRHLDQGQYEHVVLG